MVRPTVGALMVMLLSLTIPVDADEIDYAGYRPHWQGYGTTTKGGRGGTVIRVNSLLDNGDGAKTTFREAILTAGCRFVVFETSGTIVLTSELVVVDNCLTVAGQTAPSPGVTINVGPRGFTLDASEIVIQHLRFRMGNETSTGGNGDTIEIRGTTAGGSAHHIVLDHVSASWGCDEVIGINNVTGADVQDVSILDSIISEGLHRCSANSEAATQGHSKGGLFGPSSNGTATVARTLYAHNANRNPRVDPGWRIAMVNNVFYDALSTSSELESDGPWSVLMSQTSAGVPLGGGCTNITEWVHRGNIAINGQDSIAGRRQLGIRGAVFGSQVYLDGNIGYGITSATGNGQWLGVMRAGIRTNTHTSCDGTAATTTLAEADIRTNTLPSWYAASVNITPLSTVGDSGRAGGTSIARACVIANAGARPTDRGAQDRRVIGDLTDGGGSIIDTESAVGGFPVLAVNTRAWTDAASPNVIATSGTGANGVRTNREVKLEAEAQALENLAACGRGTSPPPVGSPPLAPTGLEVVK